MSELKTKLETISQIKKKILVEVPVEKVKEALDEAFKKIQKKAKIKGFREGKVPENLIRQYYGDEIQKEAIENIVSSTYADALTKESAVPIYYPKIDVGAFAKDGPFTYTATFEVKPQVTVSGIDSLKLTKTEVEVTDEEVEERLKYLQNSMTQLEPTGEEETLKIGYVAIIDFSGTADGNKFKGGDAKDFAVELGSGSLLSAFEDRIKGMKKGEVRKISFDYPSDYFNKELAGKKGEFEVSLKDLRKKLIPELNDEFAKDLGNFKTLEDVRKDLRDKTLAGKEREIRLGLYQQALDKLVEAHAFEVPEAMVLGELKVMLENFAKYLEKQGKTLEQAGVKIEEFVNKYRDEAAKRVKGYLILDAIAQGENIVVEPAEIDSRFDELAARYNQNVPTIKRYYEEKGLVDGLKMQILHEKTLDFVVNKSKIKVEKAKTEKKTKK